MLRGIACVCAIVAIVYASADILTGTAEVIHSDSSIKSILASMALDQGRLLPIGWTFANGDLLTMTPYLFSLPLTWLFGMGLASNAWATWLGYLAMLAGTWALLGRMSPADSDHRVGTWTALALVASTMSVAAYEFIVRQGAYTVYAAATMALIALLLSRPANWRAAVTFVLAFLLASSNPLRAVVTIFVPVVLAFAADGLFPSRLQGPGQRLSQLGSRNLLGMVVGALVGSAVYYAVLPSLENFNAAANISAPTAGSVAAALLTIGPDAAAYAHAGLEWNAVGPGQRVLQVIVWACWIAALLAPGIVLLRRSLPPDLRRLAWLAYAMFAAGALPLVFTQGLYTSHNEWRYVSLAMLLAWVVLAMALAGGHLLPPRATKVALAVAAVTAMVTAMSWSQYRTTRIPTYGGVSASPTELIAALREDQVGTAAATYWNSHVISVLSGGSVMVNPIAYGGARMQPFPHHAPLAPLSGTGGSRHAVILTRDEIGMDGGRVLDWQLGKPWKRHEFGVYIVLVFERPVVDEIYGAGARFDAPVQAQTVALGLSELRLQPCHAATPCMLTVEAENLGRLALSSAGNLPLRVGLQGLAADGTILQPDMGRMEFPRPLDPGEKARLEVELPPMANEVRAIRPCLIQEGVAWLCDRTQVAPEP